jgi:hypothetical protein
LVGELAFRVTWGDDQILGRAFQAEAEEEQDGAEEEGHANLSALARSPALQSTRSLLAALHVRPISLANGREIPGNSWLQLGFDCFDSIVAARNDRSTEARRGFSFCSF